MADASKLTESARIIGENIFRTGGIKTVEILGSLDGELLFTLGETDSSLYDISAFIGSVSVPVSKTMRIEDLKYAVVDSSGGKTVLVTEEDFIIGIRCQDEADPDEIAINAGKYLKPEKLSDVQKTITPAVMSKEARLAAGKIKQINFLIEEFSQDNEVRPWLDLVERKLEDFRGQKVLVNFLEIKEDNLFLNPGAEAIDEKEVNEVSKNLIDSLCRLAIEKLGPDAAKNKVHNVIQKMGFLAKKKD
ncbi:hypothetical protein JXA84_04745 [candidate division WOR-3 bacterium]|nr:hypothetical protein [candidate division WOR-3 bacterium]